MTTLLKLTADLRDMILADLRRPHAVAFERVGFILARAAALPNGGVILVGGSYLPVDDDAYLEDAGIGARVSAEGFRPARQLALRHPLSIIHVHLHDHPGRPGFSRTDARETAAFMPDFLSVRADQPHAALILSVDSATARLWMPNRRGGVPFDFVSIVGATVTKVPHV